MPLRKIGENPNKDRPTMSQAIVLTSLLTTLATGRLVECVFTPIEQCVFTVDGKHFREQAMLFTLVSVNEDNEIVGVQEISQEEADRPPQELNLDELEEKLELLMTSFEQADARARRRGAIECHKALLLTPVEHRNEQWEAINARLPEGMRIH